MAKYAKVLLQSLVQRLELKGVAVIWDIEAVFEFYDTCVAQML